MVAKVMILSIVAMVKIALLPVLGLISSMVVAVVTVSPSPTTQIQLIPLLRIPLWLTVQ
jgi:hypothetical protein